MQIEPHEVNGLLYMVVKPVFTLKTASGREIRTTGNHPYLTMSGWKKVVDIKIGEEIASTLAPAGTLGASGSPTGTRSSAKGAAPSLQALTKPIPSAENAPIQLILGNLSSSNKTIFLETFSAGIWEKTKVKAACILSNFLTRIFIQIMPACLSGENVSGSVKSKSWVKSTLDSACASFATSPFSMPSGALFASWPSSLSHLISPTWTFSSKRNSILWGDRSGGGKDGVEFYGLNDFRGEMESSPNVIWAQRWISLQNFFGGSSVFQHLDNEVNHDSRSLETRLAVANIGINPDAIFPLLNIHGSIVTEELAIDQEANVLWDKIVSIEYSGREPVWDIEVEGTHNFIGNRIFAHNTYMSGNVGIGTTAPASKFHVTGGSITIDAGGSGGLIYGTSNFVLTSGGNVGIGTSSPAGKLDVYDAQGYYQFGSRVLVSSNANTFVGSESGYSITSGSSNTFVGVRAGYSHTTGIRNAFLGRGAGYS
ncbi:hypothetical protein HY772_09175, partial [Candidatus Woesearchaeota archaeon]|nr:hypothetical protein [Candidatus Woesearchaeota archaeon]